MVITKVESPRKVVFRLRLRQSDIGKVIGKHGHTIAAIRNLLGAGAAPPPPKPRMRSPFAPSAPFWGPSHHRIFVFFSGLFRYRLSPAMSPARTNRYSANFFRSSSRVLLALGVAALACAQPAH